MQLSQFPITLLGKTYVLQLLFLQKISFSFPLCFSIRFLYLHSAWLELFALIFIFRNFCRLSHIVTTLLNARRLGENMIVIDHKPLTWCLQLQPYRQSVKFQSQALYHFRSPFISAPTTPVIHASRTFQGWLFRSQTTKRYYSKPLAAHLFSYSAEKSPLIVSAQTTVMDL